MNHFVFSAVLFSVTSFLVCLLSILHRPRSRIHRLFAAYWFSISFWSFTVGWQSILIKKISAFWWGWFLHIGCIFIPTLLLHFAFEYTRESAGKKIMLRLMYIASFFYLALNTFTTLFTSGTVYRDMYAYPRPSTFYPLYFVTFVVSVCYGTFLFIRARSRRTTRSRNIRNYLFAQVLGYMGGMDNFAIMADIRISPLYPYGLYLGVLYAITALTGRIRAMLPKQTRRQAIFATSHSKSDSPTQLPSA